MKSYQCRKCHLVIRGSDIDNIPNECMCIQILSICFLPVYTQIMQMIAPSKKKMQMIAGLIDNNST